jgi:hypothetical protein
LVVSKKSLPLVGLTALSIVAAPALDQLGFLASDFQTTDRDATVMLVAFSHYTISSTVMLAAICT